MDGHLKRAKSLCFTFLVTILLALTPRSQNRPEAGGVTEMTVIGIYFSYSARMIIQFSERMVPGTYQL
jgi:hypothetical protein